MEVSAEQDMYRLNHCLPTATFGMVFVWDSGAFCTMHPCQYSGVHHAVSLINNTGKRDGPLDVVPLPLSNKP